MDLNFPQFPVPFEKKFLNRWVAPLPLINELALQSICVARPRDILSEQIPRSSVSVIVPRARPATEGQRGCVTPGSRRICSLTTIQMRYLGRGISGCLSCQFWKNLLPTYRVRLATTPPST